MSSFLGADIALDANGDFIVDTDGDLALVEGRDCLGQDIRHRVITPKGALWYDEDYGVGLQQHLHSEDRSGSRTEIEKNIEEDLTKEPRVDPFSIEAQVTEMTADEIKLMLAATPQGESNPLNLVVGADSEGVTEE